MKKLYNTQLDISTGLSHFFKNVCKRSIKRRIETSGNYPIN